MNTETHHRPLLFLGHGSTTEHARRVLGELRTMGLNAGFDVYLDLEVGRSIPGERFTPPMYEALDRCDVAIIWMSPSALTSDWVSHEVSRLKGRADHEEGLLIVPILAEGAPPDAFDQAPWRQLGMQEIQFLSDQVPTWLPDVEHRLNQVAGAWRLENAYGHIRTALVSRLESVSPAAVEAALHALDLKISPSPWRRHQTLASHLLNQSGPESIRDAARAIAAADAALAFEIVEISLPYACFTDDHATWLRTTVSSHRGAATSYRSTHVCEMLIGRACNFHPAEWRVLPAGALRGDDPGAQLVEDVRIDLKSRFMEPYWDDDDLREELDRQRWFLVLPPGAPDPGLLEPLRRTFPSLVVFLSRTEKLDIKQLGLDVYFSHLEPAVPDSILETALRVRRDLRPASPSRSLT